MPPDCAPVAELCLSGLDAIAHPLKFCLGALNVGVAGVDLLAQAVALGFQSFPFLQKGAKLRNSRRVTDRAWARFSSAVILCVACWNSWRSWFAVSRSRRLCAVSAAGHRVRTDRPGVATDQQQQSERQGTDQAARQNCDQYGGPPGPHVEQTQSGFTDTTAQPVAKGRAEPRRGPAGPRSEANLS